MEKSKLRRADLCFSWVLILVSAWLFVQSVVLFFNPFGRRFQDIHPVKIKESIELWYQSPGLLPALLAILLCVCAVLLMRHARNDGASFDFINPKALAGLVRSREFHVVLVVGFTLFAYIFWIIPWCRDTFDWYPRFQGFPFMIATFIYLLSMMLVFAQKNARTLLTAVAMSCLAAGAITYGFGVIAMIPLP